MELEELVNTHGMTRESIQRAALMATELVFGPVVTTERTSFYKGYLKCYEDILIMNAALNLPEEKTRDN